MKGRKMEKNHQDGARGFCGPRFQKMFYKDRNSIYVSCDENYAQDLKINPRQIAGKTDYVLFALSGGPRPFPGSRGVGQKRIMRSRRLSIGKQAGVGHSVSSGNQQICRFAGVDLFWSDTAKN